MKIVADESVDFEIVSVLRKHDFTVISIDEILKGADDKTVLDFALHEKSLLITEDKDFGELVFRMKKAHLGIILIRLSGIKSADKAEITLKSISENLEKMKNAFSVISKNQTRIKK